MNGTMYTIGEMLRRARHERNLNLEKLSRSARVPPSTIWKYENEHVDYSFFTVLKLATALQKNVGYFLGEGDSGREDVLLAGPGDGVSCEVQHQHWRLDLFNRRLVGRWMVNGVLHLFAGAEVNPRKAAGEEMFLRCLEGTIDIFLGSRHYILIEGYAMQFRTSEDISLRNRGEQEATSEFTATSFPFDI